MPFTRYQQTKPVGRLQHSFLLSYDSMEKLSPILTYLASSAAILANALLLHADKYFDLMAKDTDLNVRSLVSAVNQ